MQQTAVVTVTCRNGHQVRMNGRMVQECPTCGAKTVAQGVKQPQTRDSKED